MSSDTVSVGVRFQRDTGIDSLNGLKYRRS